MLLPVPDDAGPDAFLMRRVQSGEEGAFEELVHRFQRLVFQIAFGIIDDARLSEDLTQTVFLKLWKAPMAFCDGSLAAWLRQVSRNCAIDELRRRKRYAEMPYVASDERTPFDQVVAGIDACRLHEALGGLDAAQRSVIELNFFTGLSHEQIAEHTGTPLGTVKTRIRSGLKSLRRGLQDIQLDFRDAVRVANA